VKYYRSKAASEGSKTVSADLAAAGIQTSPKVVLSFSLFYFSWKLLSLEIQFIH
jgi:equilibrative nucleoside transporter 1/2/3